ncbi:unnamed protein product [Didymodactylos carnosus]|uniref:NAD(P)(+)--arginine ADP-ribosyltransferase n=1 Tax=Didymodactylos carnosus TaxID=1234261 RepID=A0A8S2Q8D0_9BILA|nr:unnamed protein product [Didymodactylos carnosus]CAF4086425.1 unnamed protein product [Didymodactylos carnosus]
MGCSASTKTAGSVSSSLYGAISSPAYLHQCRDSTKNREKDEQRAEPQDLLQNFLLLWLDAKLDESNPDFRHSITQLRRTVDTIETFRDSAECLEYISNFEDEKAFLIVSGDLTDKIVPRIHGIPQIYAIYIFCRKQSKYEQWATKEWSKVRGVFTEIDSVCASVRQAARECDDDPGVITGELEPSFMYTILFKEIVLEIDFDRKITVPDLADYARKQKAYADKQEQLEMIDDFVRNYDVSTTNNPIRWYTAECFTYKMLNKALGKLDVGTLLKTGFFMRDLYENIQQLHQTQINDKCVVFPTKVYRGQAMTPQDFKRNIKREKLVSYNNFLSTTEERDVAVGFIRRKLQSDQAKIGVLFVMEIDPSLESVPYANITELSYSEHEKEILFATHTVFRVRQMKQTQEGDMKIWQIHLTLTSATDDQNLSKLTQSIRQDITGEGWQQMGILLRKMGQNEKAEAVYMQLLAKASTEDDKAYCHHQLALIKNNQGEYNNALQFYNQSLEIDQRTLSKDHPNLATSYCNIGQVYSNMGHYTKALEYYEKSRQIYMIALPENHPDLATSYNNIGQVYSNMSSCLIRVRI